MKQEEVIIAGFGGQGIMFAGSLLAQASMEEGLEVTFFPSYGAEIRGGTANCTVIISEKEIGSPVSRQPTTVIVLNQSSFMRFSSRLRKGGLMIINSSLIKDVEKKKGIMEIPATEIADKMGFEKGANLVILGAYIRKTGIVSLKTMLGSTEVLLRSKKELIQINQKMLKEGYNFKG